MSAHGTAARREELEEEAGHASCAHWFSFRCGFSLPVARRYVEAARKLEELPRTAEASPDAPAQVRGGGRREA